MTTATLVQHYDARDLAAVQLVTALDGAVLFNLVQLDPRTAALLEAYRAAEARVQAAQTEFLRDHAETNAAIETVVDGCETQRSAA